MVTVLPRRVNLPPAGRWATAALLMAAGPAWLPTAAGAEEATCLAASSLEPLAACEPTSADAAVQVDGDLVRVSLTNTGDTEWVGGPVAVETMARPDALAAGAPSATLPGAADGSGWVRRGAAVVARCEFGDPADGTIGPGEEVACSLPRTFVGAGNHVLWVTGFVGGVPAPNESLGAIGPAPGVVPVATPRSVAFSVDASDEVTILADPSGDGAASSGRPGVADLALSATDEEPASEVSFASLYLGGAVIALIGAATLWSMRRRAQAAPPVEPPA